MPSLPPPVVGVSGSGEPWKRRHVVPTAILIGLALMMLVLVVVVVRADARVEADPTLGRNASPDRHVGEGMVVLRLLIALVGQVRRHSLPPLRGGHNYP
ncbi:MAG: hypothetical protein ABII02_02725 [Candidatus Magasanikbacteria bacterium]